MLILLASFIVSFIVTLLIIRFQHLHNHISLDNDLSGPQKFHSEIVPRIGGISIIFGLVTAEVIKFKSNLNPFFEINLMACAIPAFSVGLIEDLTKKVSINKRLFYTSISTVIFIFIFDTQVTRIDIPAIDYFLRIPLIGFLFTIFAITGLSNAYNIIDGFNGLSSMVGILTLLALAYLGIILTDPLITNLSLTMIAAILGFFLWNYPKGKIFLGDGGAYLIGFWVASLSVLITSTHPEISPWFALTINTYPIFETLFTVYRRKIHQDKSPGQPDGMHFHSLLYRRILSKNKNTTIRLSANAQTAPYLWLLSCMTILPAVIWCKSTYALITITLAFAFIYVSIYTSIVRFKTPKWLFFN